jgi:serine phosphatase RsbU (regulator of sigma subunit)
VELSSPFTFWFDVNGLLSIPSAMISIEDQLYVGGINGVYWLPAYQYPHDHDQHRFYFIEKSKGSFDFLKKNNSLFSIGYGINKIDLKTKEVTPINSINGYCLKEFSHFSGYVFVGEVNGLQIFSWDKDNFGQNQLKFFRKIKEIKNPIRNIVADKSGHIWLTSEFNGVYCLGFVQGNLNDYYVHHYTPADGLPLISENYVYYYHDTLLVCTPKGIYHLAKPNVTKLEKNRFIPYCQFGIEFCNGRNGTMQIDFNGDNTVWINSGLNFFKGRKNKNQSWTFTDIPFKRPNTNVYKFITQQNGSVWWLSFDGLYCYQENQKDYQIPYFALIRKVTLPEGKILFAGTYYDQTHIQAGKYPIISLTQPENTIKKLPFNDNSLSFACAAAFYENPNAIQYAFKMDGYQSEWSAWLDRSFIDYTNLAKGSYRFMVKAKNIFHVESNIASFSFSIDAPWYQTYYAYFIYISLFFLTIYSFTKLYSYRLITARNRLEKIVLNRTIDLKKTRDALWGEMELAKKIQTVLLPQDLHIPGYEICAYMKPADEVGGDYYDVIEVREERRLEDRGWKVDSQSAGEKDGEPCRGGSCARPNDFGLFPKANPKNPPNLLPGQTQGFAPTDPSTLFPPSGGYPFRDYPLTSNLYPSYWLSIGDVSGHGVSAGLVMMMVQTSIRTVLATNAHLSVREILQRVNSVIYENIKKLGEDKYMSITLISVQENGQLIYSGLHQDILIYRCNSAQVEVLDTHGMWLGILESIESFLEIHSLTLQPNDVMILFTDGLTESFDQAGNMLDVHGLSKVLKEYGTQSIEIIKQTLLNRLTNYTSNDDITFMIIKKT